jgi:hypothetical protein
MEFVGGSGNGTSFSAGAAKSSSTNDKSRDWADADSYSFLGNSTFQRSRIVRRCRWFELNSAFCAAIVEGYAAEIGTPVLSVQTDDEAYNDAAEIGWYKFKDNAEKTGLTLDEDLYNKSKENLKAGGSFSVLYADTLQYLSIPSEFCGSVFSPENPNESNGVIKDNSGRVTHYRFCMPDKSGYLDFANNSVLVPADIVLHVLDRTRMLGNRERSWLTQALPVIKDHDDVEQAKVIKVKQATFLCIVKSPPPSVLSHDLGSTKLPSTPIMNPDKPLDDDENADSEDDVDVIVPGEQRIVHAEGKYEMFEPSHNITDYKEFKNLLVDSALSTIQLPPQVVITTFREDNYSSARATRNTWEIRRRRDHQILRTRFLYPLFKWFRENAEKLGIIPKCPKGQEDNFEFIYPIAPAIDPQKDTATSIARLAGGISSIQEEHALLGKDTRVVWRLRAQALALARDLGIEYNVNPDAIRSESTPNGVVPLLAPDPKATKPGKPAYKPDEAT